MKLYEFTYTNNRNWQDKDVIRALKLYLEDEAMYQQWALGWELRKIGGEVMDKDGDMVSHWEVHGEYLEQKQLESDLSVLILIMAATSTIAILFAIYMVTR